MTQRDVVGGGDVEEGSFGNDVRIKDYFWKKKFSGLMYDIFFLTVSHPTVPSRALDPLEVVKFQNVWVKRLK